VNLGRDLTVPPLRLHDAGQRDELALCVRNHGARLRNLRAKAPTSGKTSTGMPEGVPFPKIDRLLDDLERIALARSMARGT
jgi:hypothetical protein